MTCRIPTILFFIFCLGFVSSAQNLEQFKNAKLLYGFIENSGQITDQDHNPNFSVRYILPLPNNNIVLRAAGFSYDTYAAEEKDQGFGSQLNHPMPDVLEKNIQFKHHRIDVEFIGANPNAQIVASEKSNDYINYYVDEQELKVRHYGKLVYKNIYPGIDVEFIARPGDNKPIEYNWIVHPGADIKNVQVSYNGANRSELVNGKLELSLAHGKLIESIPSSYLKQSKKQVQVSYRQTSKRKNRIVLSFEGEIDQKDEILIIDPIPHLNWGTYFGGPGDVIANDISIDGSNNIYLTGSTTSLASMATTGAHQTVFQGVQDAFVTKFNFLGVRQWSTYYGGPNGDQGFGIVATTAGDIYISGWTKSATSIATSGTHQQVFGGGTLIQDGDAFVVKFNTNGVRQWGTYFGGTRGDAALGIDLDNSENIYVTGVTNSLLAISTPGSHQSTLAGSNSQDAYLAKFNSSGILQWATYYGGSGNDACWRGVTVDASGNVFLFGYTNSTDNIATPGSHQPTMGYINGSNQLRLDTFVAKFNSTGTRQWGTYYGGIYAEYAYDIAADATGNVFITGYSYSSDAISTPGSHQPSKRGATDAFLVKFNTTGVRQWGTYFGGDQGELSASVSVDGAGDVYIGGNTASINLIATSGAHQITKFGLTDSFLAKFSSINGLLQWGTYYGGPEYDWPQSIAATPSGEVFITGLTHSADKIATPGAHQTVMNGTSDSFLAKFSSTPCTAPEAAGLAIQHQQYICAIKFNTQKLSNCLTTYSWDFGDGNTSRERNPIHAYAAPGTYHVSVAINYSCSSCHREIILTKQVTYSAPSEILEEQDIEIPTDIKEEIIATGASSFSDAWPLDHLNSTLEDRCSYLNGSQGVWRNNASFVYEKDREHSTPVNIATDGSFTLEQFNWEFAAFNAVPNWIRADRMTRYSSFSYALENQDVLDVYSAALYDYGGQLQTANGVNMQNEEMAFTSFEYIDEAVTGNWIFSNQSSPLYASYTVNAGNKNMAIVEASLAELEDITQVDVITEQTYFFLSSHSKPYVKRTEIICRRVHPENPEWSVVVLKQAPIEGIWTGKLRIKNTVVPTVTGIIDEKGHTGKRSLKITSEKIFAQQLIRLQPGKSYHLNAWVSVVNPDVSVPKLSDNLGIDVLLKNKSGTTVSATLLVPEGSVIEGWQQVRGSFTAPEEDIVLFLRFKPGATGTAWYDDLRIHPDNGNMKSYVYDFTDLRLRAILDEDNFAALFYYDKEGNLYLTKKETEQGMKTITQNVSYQVEH